MTQEHKAEIQSLKNRVQESSVCMYEWNEWMNESEIKIGLDIAESTVYVIKNEQNKCLN